MHGFQNALCQNDYSVLTELQFQVTRDRDNAPGPVVSEVSLCTSVQDGPKMNFKPHFGCFFHDIGRFGHTLGNEQMSFISFVFQEQIWCIQSSWAGWAGPALTI